MARLSPLAGLLKNLKQDIPEQRRRLYLTQEQAYESLKRLTGQDFGYRIEEWQAYLSSISFHLRNTETSTAASPIDALSIVKDIKRSGGTVIRVLRSKDALRDAMQHAIDEGRLCAFWPSMAALRVLCTTTAFVSAMRDIQSQLIGYRVLVEPGAYPSALVFAIGPARSNASDCESN